MVAVALSHGPPTAACTNTDPYSPIKCERSIPAREQQDLHSRELPKPVIACAEKAMTHHGGRELPLRVGEGPGGTSTGGRRSVVMVRRIEVVAFPASCQDYKLLTSKKRRHPLTARYLSDENRMWKGTSISGRGSGANHVAAENGVAVCGTLSPGLAGGPRALRRAQVQLW